MLLNFGGEGSPEYLGRHFGGFEAHGYDCHGQGPDREIYKSYYLES